MKHIPTFNKSNIEHIPRACFLHHQLHQLAVQASYRGGWTRRIYYIHHGHMTLVCTSVTSAATCVFEDGQYSGKKWKWRLTARVESWRKIMRRVHAHVQNDDDIKKCLFNFCALIFYLESVLCLSHWIGPGILHSQPRLERSEENINTQKKHAYMHLAGTVFRLSIYQTTKIFFTMKISRFTVILFSNGTKGNTTLISTTYLQLL